jgi:hypothetical protein
MAFSLVAHTSTNTTSAGIDTSGANLIVIVLGSDVNTQESASIAAPTDNKMNTYTQLTPAVTWGTGAGGNCSIWYLYSPSVGAGHTFTNNATEFATQGFYSVIAVAAFSGSASAPLDQQSTGTTGSGTTVQPGSVTPGSANELLVAGCGFSSIGTISVDSGFTITDQPSSASGGKPMALAYLIQGAAGALNPTFTNTVSGPNTNGAVIATFKSSGGVAVVVPVLLLVGNVQGWNG